MNTDGGFDPRVQVLEADGVTRLAGARCRVCGLPLAGSWRCCPGCRGAVEAAEFEAVGTIWSWTVVRVSLEGRTPPYELAYLDIDGGPRILVHLQPGTPPRIGRRASVVGLSDTGDCLAEVEA